MENYILDKEWDNDNNNNKIYSKINDCIIIEKNTKIILEINKIEKFNNKKINIKFTSEKDEEINELIKIIQNFGKINKISNCNL